MKNLLSNIGLLSLIFVAYLLFTSGNNTIGITPDGLPMVRQVPMPSSINFLGEAVPLENRYARESIDYELTAIVYRHAYTSMIMKFGNRWLPIIEAELRKQGIHDDLKYIAIAESGLENTTSPKDAKGVWQFLQGTATQYGLEVSDDVDERYHLEKATVAACKYFKDAHKKFNNWAMAAASYNCGMGALQDEIGKQQTWNYYDMNLNYETSRYVYKSIAYKQVFTNPQLYGYYLNPADLYPSIPTTEKTVTAIDDIATFAQENKSTYREIKLLNPWLRKHYLRAKPGKTYTVKVPIR